MMMVAVAFLSASGYALAAIILAVGGNPRLALAYMCWAAGNVALAVATSK